MGRSASWWFVLVVLCLAAGFLVLADDNLMVDEIPHYEQAVAFSSGVWSVNPDLTVIPGYHVLLSSLSFLTGWSSVVAFRFFTVLFSLCAVVVFFFLARELAGRDASWRSLGFFFLPLLFPFFFLLYTDVLSLLFVLLLLLFAVRGQHSLGGLFGLLACLVRQNNVVWVAFVLVWSYVDAHGFRWRPVRESLREYWSYVLVGFLFVLYVLVNGGVSLGDAPAHPSFHFSLMNVWFFLFLSLFLFLPLAYAHRRELFSVMGKWWFWVAFSFLLAVFAFTFQNTHPYNVDWGEYFLRNRLLIFFSSAWWWKLVFFVPVLFGVLLYAFVPLRKGWWLLYPFSFLFLVPSLLVEQRYYIIPLSLFLLVRKKENKSVEMVQLAWFFFWSLGLFLVVASGRLFL